MDTQESAAPVDLPAPLPSPFPVVGIGASAGGLAALTTLLENMPPAPGMALIVVLHLSADRPSAVDKLLQRVTAMPVLQVTRRTAIQPDHVYVIAPGRSLRMEDGHLMVEALKRERGALVTIDTFLRTLAQAHNEHAVGVILSGMGSDGVSGLASIKEHGGVTIAQLPSDAEESSMPQSAIDSGMADFVLGAAQMAGKLLEIRDVAHEIRKRGLHAETPSGNPPVDMGSNPAATQEAILAALREHTGHDFRHYKPGMVRRRLERRLQVRNLPDMASYHALLQRDADEPRALLKDLLIGVTSFFRDRTAFDMLARLVLPQLVHGKAPEDQVRAWVPACSTGEEAYSLGMLLADELGCRADPPGLQLFASDIDERAIAIAREGRYPDAIGADVPPALLARYFSREGDGYRMRRTVRDRILFTRHNLLHDPAFSRLDLISCRNFLIYLNRDMHRRVLEMFHSALNPGGYLFLGSIESADAAPDLFAPIDAASRLYQAKPLERQKHHLSMASGTGFDRGGPPPPRMPVARDLVDETARARHRRPESAEQAAADDEDLHCLVEQLRATVEGLETEREELQSRNEELHTINAELQMKVEETGAANDDLSNVIASTDIAILFLDHDLRIKRYTPHVRRIFNVIPTDIDRPLAHITSKLDYPNLLADAAKVCASLQPAEREARNADGHEYIVRIHPYHTAEDRIDGVVVTFFDISGRRQAEAALRKSEEQFRLFVMASSDMLYKVNADWTELRDLQGAPLIAYTNGPTRDWLERYIPAEDQALVTQTLGSAIAARSVFELEHRVIQPDGGIAWVFSRAIPLLDDEGNILEWFGAASDISERKRGEAAVHASEARLAAELSKTKLLQQLSTELIQEQRPQVLNAAILDAAMTLMQSDAATIQLLDRDGERLVLVAAKNIHPQSQAYWREVDSTQASTCGLALRKGERLTIEDVEASPEMAGSGDLDECRRSGVRAVQSTPLMARSGRLIGMLSTHWHAPRRFVGDDFNLFDVLARQLSDLIERAHTEDTLREREALHRADLERQVWERTAELKQSRDLLQATMDASTDMIQVFEAVRDEGGTVVDFRWLLSNHAAELQYGEVGGQSLLERNPGVVDEGVFDTFRQVVETGQPHQAERHYPHEQFDGWFLQSVVKLGDGVATTTKDITEWKRAQEEVLRLRDDVAQASLLASEAKYLELIDFIPAAVYACNADATLAYYNSRAVTLWGRTPDTDDQDWTLCGSWRTLLPDGGVLAPGESPMASVLATGEPVVNRELRIERPDGSLIDILVNITALRDADGQVTGAINIFQDISDRKRADAALRESESRFRALAEASPALIWQLDGDGKVVYLNQRYLEVTGLGQDEALLLDRRSVVHPDDADAYLAAVDAALREHTQVQRRVRLRTADGDWHWFESHGHPWYAAQGDYRGLVGISIDVNETVRAEEALKTADRRKDEFLATLAHELRNPLAPISNAVQLLRYSSDRGNIDRLLEMAERQVKQMVRLVDDLMEVTRITRGKIELRRAPVALADILHSAVETSQPAFEHKRHRVTVSLPEEPVLLVADKVRMTQVFSNLLNNAAKYTPPEGSITLTAYRQDRQAVVTLRDTGMGIGNEQMPLIFEMFSQPHGRDGHSESGLGIGLTMVRSLVHLHGGSVEASSAGPGQGSEFTVRLPLLETVANAAHEEAQTRDATPLAGQSTLIVDDNRDAADSLCQLLAARGATAAAVYGGRAAIEALERVRPDAILLDIGMPDMDGYEVAQHIRADRRFDGIRIIALTGWGQHTDRLRSQACGFDAHLTKPADLDVLQDILVRR